MRRTWLALSSLALLATAVLFLARGPSGSRGAARGGVAPSQPDADASADPVPDLSAPKPAPGHAAGALVAAGARDAEATGREAAPAVPVVRATGLAFVDPDAAPLAGVAWIALRGSATIASGRSDAAGFDVLPDTASTDGEPLELVAAVAGFAPIRVALDTLPRDADGRRMATLGAGLEVSGVVRVDGAEPTEAVVLKLGGDVALIDAVGLPPEARVPILSGMPNGTRTNARSGACGAFRLRGLPDGWSGTLSWENAYAFESAAPAAQALPVGRDPHAAVPAYGPEAAGGVRAVRVAAPLAGLVLELSTAPYLFGRVGDPATGGETAAGAMVRLTIGSTTRSGPADADGSFRFVFPGGLPEHVDVEVSAGASSAVSRHAIEIPPGVRRHDTGTLWLPSAIEVPFRVVDEAGEPIANSNVEPVPPGRSIQKTVASDGTGVLHVEPRTRAVRAVALGYAAAEKPLPPTGETLVIELARGPVLVVTLPAGERDASVFLTGDEPPFEDAGGPTWVPEVGVLGTEMTLSGDSLELGGAEDGRYELGGLGAGVGFTVAARDELGRAHDERSMAPFAPGERREIALAFELERHTVRGRVVGPDGEPLAGARVALGASLSCQAALAQGWAPSLNAETDADGRFEIAEVPLARGDVAASAAGYAPARLAAAELDGPPLVLVLERGREVRLAIVDDTGAPVPGALLQRIDGSGARSAGATKDGEVHVIPHAPAATFDVLVSACGRREIVTIPDGVDAVRHDVGRVIRCTVELPGRNGAWDEPNVAVTLTCRDVEPPIWLQRRVPAGAESVAVDALLPGVYAVTAERSGLQGEQVAHPRTVAIEEDGARVVLTVRAR
jgi:hypothetical protein